MIDWRRIDELKAEIGHDAFAEVAGMFLEEAEAVVRRLPQVSPAMLEAELHALKGSALNLGLAALVALCAEGERRAAAGQPVDIDLLIRCHRTSHDAFVAGAPGAASAA
ncbi:MAG: Hpt domain-containing protein [Rhodobacterales bacterium]|nr:Hpt domain-containing protein [Rhodobacterales bacterium]